MTKTYTDALAMTKAQIFEYIVANSPETHVAKSWNREHLLNTFANAFPAPATEATVDAADDIEPVETYELAKTVTMSFGPTITKFLVGSGFTADSISPADRGKFTFDVDGGIEIEAALVDAQSNDEHKSIRRNLGLAEERVQVRLAKLS